MSHLTRHDYALALVLIARLEPSASGLRRFMQATLAALRNYVAFERGHFLPVRAPPFEARSAPGERGLEFMATLGLAMEAATPMALELRRRGHAFSERDCARLALLQPHLAFLYRHARVGIEAAAGPQPEAFQPVPCVCGARLTQREADVMQWLACGKTDADIAALLAISPRTVHKHLEHIYEKLGVETRTAAVMAVQRSAGGGRAA